MAAEVSQQSSLQFKHNCARQRKLRMSCDACSSSKIKCDQSRPICSRCQKLGIKCNYSVSRRMGKPPSASRALANSANGPKSKLENRSSRTPDAEIDSLLNGSQSDHVESDFHRDSAFPTMDMSLPIYEDIMSAPWHGYMTEWSDCSTSDLSMTTASDFDPDFNLVDTSSLNQFTQLGPIYDIQNVDDKLPNTVHGAFGLAQGDTNLSSSTSPDPLPTSESSDWDSIGPGCHCTMKATSTLHRISLDSQTGNVLPTNSTSSIDQILITNKSAVESVSAILACPCSRSPQSSILLALIIDKILTRYRSIIQNDSRDRASSVSSTSSADSNLRATPITLGSYRIDAEDEHCIRTQLVSNELRKAMTLVKKYTDRYLTGESKGEDGGIYAALASFLKERVNEGSQEIVRALQNSSVKELMRSFDDASY